MEMKCPIFLVVLDKYRMHLVISNSQFQRALETHLVISKEQHSQNEQRDQEHSEGSIRTRILIPTFFQQMPDRPNPDKQEVIAGEHSTGDQEPRHKKYRFPFPLQR